MLQWYVIQTKPQREANVCSLLRQGNFETFSPKIQDYSYRGGNALGRLTPLFPSYIFIHTNFLEECNHHLVKYTRGVSRILSAAGHPIPLSDEFIDILKERMGPDNIVRRYHTYKTGDLVRVKKGMLKDLIGIIEKPVSREDRVLVLLKLVNYDMKAKLHCSEIERVEKQPFNLVS